MALLARTRSLVDAKNKPRSTILVVGKENVGKTQLCSTLTGSRASVSNFRGATVDCTSFTLSDDLELVDSPGIIRDSDTKTTELLLDRLSASDEVIVVVQATNVDDDLKDLIPLVDGKRGLVLVTFWDKVASTPAAATFLDDLRKATGTPVIATDARSIDGAKRQELLEALDQAATIDASKFTVRGGFRIEPKPIVLDRPVIGPLLSAIALIAPAAVAVWIANSLAGVIDPPIQNLVAPAIESVQNSWPPILRDVVAGSYSLLEMGPLLLVWAVPTVFIFALLMGALKASGLMDRIATAINPLVQPFGVDGRDVLRVAMGFGCNVPAVVQTRSSSGCSRDSCLSAIAYGSACSYQLGATLAVFAAVGRPGLVVPYLGYLLVTLLIYTRIVSPPESRSKLNRLLINERSFLLWPDVAAVWRESRVVLRQFFRLALPIFVLITIAASLLDLVGLIDRLSNLIGPMLAVFNLPIDAAPAIAFSAIRKDGVILLAESDVAAALSTGQVLTAVFLAGTVVPCLVTALTIARERTVGVAAKIVGRQAVAAIIFSVILAWSVVGLGALL